MTPLVSTLLQLAVLAANIDPPADAEWPLNRQLGAWNPPSVAAEFAPSDSLFLAASSGNSLVRCEPLLPAATQLVVPAQLDLPKPAYEAPDFIGQLWGGIRERPETLWLGLRLRPVHDNPYEALSPEPVQPTPYRDPTVPEAEGYTIGPRPCDYWYFRMRSTDAVSNGFANVRWLMPWRPEDESPADDLTPFHARIPQVDWSAGTGPANEWLQGFGPDLEKLSREIQQRSSAPSKASRLLTGDIP
jgi:hypothetical protein